VNGVVIISIKGTESLLSDISDTVEKNGYVLAIRFISTRDNGNGIDPEIQSRLFSKFTTKSDIGTGLGIFIAKSIIEVHGGKISPEIVKMEEELLLHLVYRLISSVALDLLGVHNAAAFN
jgi:signal transduction histidine kinase